MARPRRFSSVSAYKKYYYAVNRTAILAKRRAYRKKHRDQVNAASNRAYYRNKEEHLVRRKEYASRNKSKITAAIRLRRKVKKAQVIDYLGGRCADCRGVFPSYCYDLHHVNPKTKSPSFRHIRSMAWAKVVKELKKCVLLCAICHRIRHYQESNNKSAKL